MVVYCNGKCMECGFGEVVEFIDIVVCCEFGVVVFCLGVGREF